MTYIKFCVIPFVFVITACAPEHRTYENPGDVIKKLNVTAEVIDVDLTSATMLSDLTKLIQNNPPTRIIVNCPLSDVDCKKANDIILNSNIPSTETGSGDTIALVYEKITADECHSGYVNNSSNAYNLNHPSFGCSMRSNTLNMVSDKKQFTNPKLSDFRSGEKAVKNYNDYITPPVSASESKGLSEKLVAE
jgi:hypothetical protein